MMNDEREAKLAEQYRLQGVVRSGFDGMEVEVRRREIQPHRRRRARRPRPAAAARRVQRPAARAGARLFRAA